MANNQRLSGRWLSNCISNIKPANCCCAATKLMFFLNNCFHLKQSVPCVLCVSTCSVCFKWANCANPLQWRQPLHWLLLDSIWRELVVHLRIQILVIHLRIQIQTRFKKSRLCSLQHENAIYIYTCECRKSNWRHLSNCIDEIFPLSSSSKCSLENWPVCDLIPVFNPTLLHPC